MTGLDLHEGDLRWQALVEGGPGSYTGEAVNPRHLSLLERALGYGKPYVAASYGEGAAAAAAAPGGMTAFGKGAAEVGDLAAAGGGNGVKEEACEGGEGVSGRCSIKSGRCSNSNSSRRSSERREGVKVEEGGRSGEGAAQGQG